MNKIHVLDCTLRDGGYCNQWKFGAGNIKKIVNKLAEANIDVIECGYISDKVDYDEDSTKYGSVSEINKFIPWNKKGKLYVAMVNYGECDIETLPECKASGLDGIRVAFHKKDVNDAMTYCRLIMCKGYKVFVQPMVSMSYTDEEFLALINKVNEISPYAFYIVDSFGMMKKKNLIRLFYMIEHNLKKEIWIGFHAHNNMQLAYANAQCLVDIQTSRSLLIDASVYGMGRGAGNLNTELFVEYLNEYSDGKYLIKPLLYLIDEILNDFYKKNYWGYSLPKYLSATHNVHPNYASFFDEKNTLTVEAMDEIFGQITPEKKFEFDRNYAEALYHQYMALAHKHLCHVHKDRLKEKVLGKKILLIAPGKSSETDKDKILRYIEKEDVVSVGINFEYKNAELIFISNLIRFRDLGADKYKKCIVTSNIFAEEVYAQVKYDELLVPIASVQDNAGMMAIRLMIELGAEEIYLAGFDGYSHFSEDNYSLCQRALITKPELADAMNEGISQMIRQFENEIPVRFITKSIYQGFAGKEIGI